MTVDTEDRVPVPHFKQRLWTELARLHTEQAEHAEAGGASSPGPRRRRLVVAAAAVTVVATVATAAVLTSSRSDVETGDAYTLLPASTPFDEDRDVVAQLMAATGRAEQEFIVHTVTHKDRGTREAWVDWSTMRYRGIGRDADGVPTEETGGALIDATDDAFGEHLGDDDVLRIVSHCRREVTDESGSGMTGTPAWPFRDGPDDFTLPGELTAAVDGHETVDGEQLTRVKVVETGEVVLVDPVTSLAVSGITDPGTPDQQLTTYEYLPRSPENLELLTPPSVPDGYEHVDMGGSQGRIEAPPWDDDRPVPQPDCL